MEKEREKERFGKREIDRKRVRVCVRESMCIFYVRTCVNEREREGERRGRQSSEGEMGERERRGRKREKGRFDQ